MKFKESCPIYLQIADRICDEICQGLYVEEGRIPSVREYAVTVEVNVNTVVRSYDYLQSQEIIYNKRGLGYFVSHGAVEAIRQQRKTHFMQVELPEILKQFREMGLSPEGVARLYGEYLKDNP
ncbi:MAG: GntR family transcriptional regulator [Bacteroidaceae bacterium]|nr:GntR family transcriptional regulator [Bacteroidaceae bacterium]